MAPMDPSASLMPFSMQKSEAAVLCTPALNTSSGSESCLSNLLQGLQEMPCYLKYFSPGPGVATSSSATRFTSVLSDSPMLGDSPHGQSAKCDYSTVTCTERVDPYLSHMVSPALEIDPIQEGPMRFAADSSVRGPRWDSSALCQSSSSICGDLHSVIPPSSFESSRGVIPPPASIHGGASAAMKNEPLLREETHSEERNVPRQPFHCFTPEVSETSLEGLLQTSSTVSSSSGSQVHEQEEEGAVCANPLAPNNPASAAESLLRENLARENYASMTHAMLYRSVFPSAVDIAAVKSSRPKRRNVKISKDPQSVAARHRRERISDRIRVLQRLVPGGTKMDTASMLDEAISYVKFLKAQVQTLESVSNAAGTFDPRLGFGPGSFFPNSSLPYRPISMTSQGLSAAPEHAMYGGAGTAFHAHSSFEDAFREQFCH